MIKNRGLITATWLGVIAGCIGWVTTVSAQVTIQIVNDSGVPDASVFVKVPGKLSDTDTNHIPITPTNLFVDINNTNPPNPVSIALSNLTPVSQLVSPISGTTNPIYSFQADYIASGSIYFTYRTPFTFTNALQPSPPPDSAGNAYRYDYAELSISDTNAANNAMDVTYVDKFGIPLQLEWFHGTNLVAGSYVYASTKTLADLFASNNLAAAVFSLNASNISSGWQYTGPDSYTNFARILAPQKVSGTSTSVAPYPSINGYLNSLVGKPFALNGASPQAGFYYVGYQASVATNASSWVFTLTYDSNNVPAFDSALITGVQYTNTLSFTVSNSNASQYIYGAPVGPNLYTVNGSLVTSDTGGTYPVETWMIGDVLSAINYGFWNGNYGNNSEQWYSEVEWTSFPFGWARPTDDGNYNLYAALIYYNSDPYSFAFSERITPDVLLAPANGDTVRITILPDDRLDSPVVSTSMITSDSITLNWNPVPGATNYQVNVLRPLGYAPVNVSSNSYPLSGLSAGTPYVMSVQALGTANGNRIITPARPVYATISGSTTVTNGTFTQVQVSFSAADPYYQLAKVYINGNELWATNQWNTTNNFPARWVAAKGTNQVAVTIVGVNHEILFNDWLTFVLAEPFTVTNNFSGTNYTPVTNIDHEVTYVASDFFTNICTMNSAVSDIFWYGQKRSQPAPGSGGFLSPVFYFTSNNIPNIPGLPTNYVASAASFLVSTQNPTLSISLSYVPAETRKFAPVTTIGPAGTFVTISNVAALPEGGIQFTFDVPAGTNYVIEASSDLKSWQTNSTGIGQAGGESYTNVAGANAVQFYRIKL